MRFQHYTPTPSLQPLLQGYLEADCRNTVVNTMYPLFPNGLSGIFFNFGNPGRLILEREYATAPVSIFGQIDQRFFASDGPGFYSLGVLFKPTVLSKFLRVDMSEFTNKAIEGTLLRSDLGDLHDKLQHTNNIYSKTSLLNEYFCSTLLNIPAQTTISDHAVELINAKADLSMEQLADKLNFSQRYLEINFKRSVGLSPKSYSVIQRFIRTAQRLKETPRLNNLSFGDEFYDQMHLIKNFKRFTGFTPTQYQVENLEMGKSYLVRL